ncbi:MAG: ABC transporter ATP-binding protein [Candidatus Sigynarchaeota archaeon]
MGGDDKLKYFHFQDVRKEFMSEQGEKFLVLENVTFSIKQGTVVSLVGPSGCGKTTFLRIVAGFDASYSGTVKVEESGALFSTLPLGSVGYIPQEISLFPWYTVEDNVAFSLRIRGIQKIERDRRVAELLRMVHLEPYRKFYPKELSGGMKQKVTICRALASPTMHGLILLDEPFSALDAQTRNALQADLLRIQKSENLTLLFVTHNIDEAVFISDKVVVLTGIPTRVKNIVPVGLSHPRDRKSSDFNAMRKEILNQCESMPLFQE